jgi:hypothetical protein
LQQQPPQQQQQLVIHNIITYIMSSFMAFEALATAYISSAATSASSMCVFRLHGLDQDIREKIFESVHDPRSNPSRTFQDTPHINLFSIVLTIPYYFFKYFCLGFTFSIHFASIFISQFHTQRFEDIFVCLMMRLPYGERTWCYKMIRRN